MCSLFSTGCSLLSSSSSNTDSEPDEVPRFYLDRSLSESGTGKSWDQAFNDIDMAILALENNPNQRELWIADGAFDISSTLVIPEGTIIYGSFDGNETHPDQRSLETLSTVFDGQEEHQVLTLEEGVILDGLIVQNGSAAGVDHQSQSGAGVSVIGARAEFRSCNFINNVAQADGGGIYCNDGSITVIDCVFSGNHAGKGAGIQISHGEITVSRSRFVENMCDQSGGLGGAIATYDSEGFLHKLNCEQNVATDHGGALWFDISEICVNATVLEGNVARFGGGSSVFQSKVIITNSIFLQNIARFSGSAGGGAINSNSNSLPDLGCQIVNCAFVDNTIEITAGRRRGAGTVLLSSSSDDVMSNCVFYGNEGQNGAVAYISSDSNCNFRRCAIDGAFEAPWFIIDGGELIFDDTTFTDISDPFENRSIPKGVDDSLSTEDDGLHPNELSVLRDSGNPNFLNDIIKEVMPQGINIHHDILGRDRKGLNDIGAYQVSVPMAPANG